METKPDRKRWWQYTVAVRLIVLVVIFLLVNVQVVMIQMYLTPEAGRLWFQMFSASSSAGGTGIEGLLYGLGGASLLGGGYFGAQKAKDWR